MIAPAPPGAEAEVVVLRMPQYRNPFLWMAVLMGGVMTAIPSFDSGPYRALAEPGPARTFMLVGAALTVAFSGLAVLLYRATLTIDPRGFREDLAIWGTVAYEWTQVSAFYIREDEEAVDAVGYNVTDAEAGAGAKFKHRTGGQIIAGSYPGGVRALCERLNRAREGGLPPGRSASTSAPMPRASPAP